MRKCANCNKLCPDTEKFCQTCGLPTTAVEETENGAAETKPAKKKKTGLIIGIVGALAVIAAIAAIVLIPKRNKGGDPMHRFFDAQEKFIENKELVEKGITVDSLMCGEYKPEIQEISTDAELSLDLQGATLPGIDLSELGLGEIDLSEKLSKLSLLFQIDAKKSDTLAGIKLRYNGSSIISATIEKLDNGLGIYIPELSDKRYELSAELLSTLMGADDTVDTPIELPESVDIKFDRVADLKASYETLKKDYEEIFYKGFAVEDFVQKDGAFKLKHLGNEIASCNEITYTPNAERLSSMLAEMTERMKSDKALSDHILTLMEKYLGKDGMNFILSACASDGEIELGENGLLPVFEKIAEKFNESRDELVKSINEANLTWRVAANSDETFAEYIAWDKGNITVERFDENVYLDIIEEGKPVINITTDLKKSGETLSGKVKVSGGEDEFKADIQIDGCDQTVKSALGIPYGKYNIDISAKAENEETNKLGIIFEVAKAENGGTDHKVTLTGLDALGEEAPERIAFNLRTTDKPSTAERANAETVRVESEEQFNSVLEDVSKNLSGVLMRLMLLLMF